MPNLAEICAKCKAETEKAKLTYLEELERLQTENEQLKSQPVVSNEPDIRDRIIALIAPAIEWKEQFYTNGEYAELITLYRTYKPKKEVSDGQI